MKIFSYLSIYWLTFYLWLGPLKFRKRKVSLRCAEHRTNKDAAGVFKTETERDVMLVAWIVLVLLLLHSISKSKDKTPRTAPKVAERCLSSILSEEKCESLIGDLQEEYEKRLKMAGEFQAKFWLYKQVLTSVRPLVSEAIKAKITSWLLKAVR